MNAKGRKKPALQEVTNVLENGQMDKEEWVGICVMEGLRHGPLTGSLTWDD